MNEKKAKTLKAICADFASVGSLLRVLAVAMEEGGMNVRVEDEANSLRGISVLFDKAFTELAVRSYQEKEEDE